MFNFNFILIDAIMAFAKKIKRSIELDKSWRDILHLRSGKRKGNMCNS